MRLSDQPEGRCGSCRKRGPLATVRRDGTADGTCTRCAERMAWEATVRDVERRTLERVRSALAGVPDAWPALDALLEDVA